MDNHWKPWQVAVVTTMWSALFIGVAVFVYAALVALYQMYIWDDVYAVGTLCEYTMRNLGVQFSTNHTHHEEISETTLQLLNLDSTIQGA